jgi:hypothetical protein
MVSNPYSPEGEPIVHTVKSERRAVDDDYQRRLLGIVGQYL